MCAIISDKSCSFFQLCWWLFAVRQLFSSRTDNRVCSCTASLSPSDNPPWHFTRINNWKRELGPQKMKVQQRNGKWECWKWNWKWLEDVKVWQPSKEKMRPRPTWNIIEHVLWMWKQGEVHSASFSLKCARNWKLLLVDVGHFLIFWIKDCNFKYPSQLDYHSGQSREISCYIGRNQ